MKFIIPTIFLTFFISTIAFAQGGRATMPKAPYITVPEVRQWQKEGKPFTLVDVREPKEYKIGHIEGAVNIPYAQVEDRIGEFRRDQTYVVYCIYSSWRAPYVGNLLADFGFDNIYVLDGGAAAWNAGGQIIYPTSKETKIKIAPYPKDLTKDLKRPPDNVHEDKIYLTTKELRLFDGKSGRPAYVAMDGVVYDVTQSRLWRGGEHDPSHGKAVAGRDLTHVIEDSPHGRKNMEQFPIVGWIRENDED